jgi:hypothetical protein
MVEDTCGGSCANALTDPALDPPSGMPAFKACAVAVRLLEAGPAGAGDGGRPVVGAVD